VDANESHGQPDSALQLRARIAAGAWEPSLVRAAIDGVPPGARDAWVDRVLGLGPPPDDGPALPRGCVPYLPCAVQALLRLADEAPLRADDVLVDIGAGVGRAAALLHLVTGACAVGLEVQPALVTAARDLVARLRLPRVSFVEGDAAALTGALAAGTVFLLYCPFSGERLARTLAALEAVARTRAIRVCAVDLPLPPCAWLEEALAPSPELAIHRSRAPAPAAILRP
jgi:SAM-dependent methyltransferase